MLRSLEIGFVGGVLLLSAGAFAPLWTNPTAHNVSEGQGSMQAVWAALYVATALLLALHGRVAWGLIRRQKLMATLLLLSFASVLWSEDPALTLRKALALLGTTTIGVLLAIRFSVREQIKLVAGAITFAALTSVIAAICFPQLFPATEFAAGAWNGIFSHKNLLGRTAALGTVAWMTWPRRTASAWVQSVAGIALCSTAVLLSHSRTALIVVLIVLLLRCVGTVAGGDWRTVLGSTLLLMVPLVALVGAAVAHVGTVTQAMQRDASLTGRTRIWLFATLSIAQRPWLGYGYGAFWWVARQSKQALALIRYETPHAHNGFLDLLLQLGIVGTAVFTLAWMISTASAVRHLLNSNEAEAWWPLLYLVFLALYSVTENSLLIANSILWILYVAAACNVAPPQTESSRSAASLKPEAAGAA
jgi:O-antigen ligase